ncbi:UNVERIFIED_ORG: hypothetical protein M2393_003545 [Pseudomonas psychrophila]
MKAPEYGGVIGQLAQDAQYTCPINPPSSHR